MRRTPLAEVVLELARTHGEPEPPPPRGALEWIAWETVGYLCDDARRAEAFAALRRKTRLQAGRILAAPLAELTAITRIGGIHPGLRARRLHEIAELALEEFGGDLEAVLARPEKEALAALKKFPAIGPPGAEKILLMTGARPLLALESNGLRALVRLGFGTEAKSYDATYRSVAAAVAGEIAGRDCAWLSRAHHLLRRHGQTLCRRSEPRCRDCPLSERCAWSGNAGAARIRA
jgi:endonuclease III